MSNSAERWNRRCWPAAAGRRCGPQGRPLPLLPVSLGLGGVCWPSPLGQALLPAACLWSQPAGPVGEGVCVGVSPAACFSAQGKSPLPGARSRVLCHLPPTDLGPAQYVEFGSWA